MLHDQQDVTSSHDTIIFIHLNISSFMNKQK